jgi:hypothetical protein
MRRWALGLVLLSLGGCSAPIAVRTESPVAPPPAVELPRTSPTVPVLDGKGLPSFAQQVGAVSDGLSFRRLREIDCLLLAAAQSAGAKLLDEENRSSPVPGRCASRNDNPERELLRRSIRYHAALELRNRAAADALERYFQLAEVEAGGDLVRKGFTIIDPLLTKAREARARNIRYPLDPDELQRQRSQLIGQQEQTELASRLLNLDLKRRLGLPYQPEGERLWPVGDFAIDPTPIDPEQAATAALADRPELRGLRALQAGLTPEMLPDAREVLSTVTPLAGGRAAGPAFALMVQRLMHHRGPDAATLAELDLRRRQLAELIASRERQIADEARAAALTLNAQRTSAMLARDRLRNWDERLAEAVRKREANQPNAELFEAQVRMEWLKAKLELIGEVAAWHRARIKLRAAMGWLAWEAVGTPTPP